MNREILFRGKTIMGDWIEGFSLFQYYCDGDYWCISRSPISANDYSEILGDYEEIIPETVGQYTGLTDKNGKKIFEGDIVKHYNHCDIKEYSEDIGRVFYYTETCRFLRTSKLFPDDCPEIYSSCEYEVIGNIYDNPELLEVRK